MFHMLSDIEISSVHISFTRTVDCQMSLSVYLDYNKKWVFSLLVSLLAVVFFIGLVIKHKDTKNILQEKNKGEIY